MEWIAWVLIGLVLWLISSVIIVGLMTAAGMNNRCSWPNCDYDEDSDGNCARCHE